MTQAVLAADIGDVLVTTHPAAHYCELAALTRRPVAEVRARIEDVDLPASFERGTLVAPAFATRLRERLDTAHLDESTLWDAWNTVVGNPVRPLVELIVPLADAGRLVLASNTNPWHWSVVVDRLAAAGLPVGEVPAVLSFEVGHAKPEPGFFRALRRVSGPSTTFFVDDRAAHVRAARAHGFIGWTHRDIDATVARVRALTGPNRRPDRRRGAIG